MSEPLSTAPRPDRVADVRRFNRLYTRRIGALDASHLGSDFSLAEARVLYELAHAADAADGGPTATGIGRALGLDAGYLSRMLRGFERRGLVERTRSSRDARRSHLRLTAAGRTAFAGLDERAGRDVAAMLGALAERDQERLLGAMHTVERVLAGASTPVAPDPVAPDPVAPDPVTPAFRLRAPGPGDLGWVVARHGVLYAREHGWDTRFEALVARIVADFVDQHDPARERCWIAERDGANVASVFLVRHPERANVARLRLLLVEPSARGLGLGQRLVDECTRFARAAGYHTITLWTNSVLVAARRLYEAAGYRLVDEAPHHSFGHALVGQTWELTL